MGRDSGVDGSSGKAWYDARMRMPRLLVLSLALAFDLACSTVASDDDEAGVTTNHSSSEGSTGDGDGSTGTGTGTGTSTTDGASTDDEQDTDPVDEGPKLDIPLQPDLPVGDCTTAWLSWEQVAAVYPDCAIEPDGGGGCWTEPMIGCSPPGPSGCSCPEGDCVENWSECAGDGHGWVDAVPLEVCGPYVIDGLCCSIGEFTYGCAE
jgi:hypothetical protein